MEEDRNAQRPDGTGAASAVGASALRLIGFSLTWFCAFAFAYTDAFVPARFLSDVQIDVLRVSYLLSIAVAQFVLSTCAHRLVSVSFRVPLCICTTAFPVAGAALYCALPVAPQLAWCYVAIASLAGTWQGAMHVLWTERMMLQDSSSAARTVFGGTALGAALLLVTSAAASFAIPIATGLLTVLSTCLYIFDLSHDGGSATSTDLPSRKLKKGLQKSSAAFIVYGAVLGASIYACATPEAAHDYTAIGIALCAGALAMLLVNLATNRMFGLDEAALVLSPAIAIVLLVQIYVSDSVNNVLYPLLIVILTAFDSTAFNFQLKITRLLGLCPFASIARGRSFVQTGMFAAALAYCLVVRMSDTGVNGPLLIPLVLVGFLFLVTATCSKTDFVPRALVDKPLPEIEDEGAQPEAKAEPVDVVKRMCEDYDLSARERDVLDLLLSGYTIAGMAEKLVISQNTVKSHCYHIYRKMGINSKQEAVNIRDQYEQRYKQTP